LIDLAVFNIYILFKMRNLQMRIHCFFYFKSQLIESIIEKQGSKHKVNL